MTGLNELLNRWDEADSPGNRFVSREIDYALMNHEDDDEKVVMRGTFPIRGMMNQAGVIWHGDENMRDYATGFRT